MLRLERSDVAVQQGNKCSEARLTHVHVPRVTWVPEKRGLFCTEVSGLRVARAASLGRGLPLCSPGRGAVVIRNLAPFRALAARRLAGRGGARLLRHYGYGRSLILVVFTSGSGPGAARHGGAGSTKAATCASACLIEPVPSPRRGLLFDRGAKFHLFSTPRNYMAHSFKLLES